MRVLVITVLKLYFFRA